MTSTSALPARRSPVSPISLETCSYCQQPSDELVTYVDGVAICLACRAREQKRIDEAYADAGYGAMGPLEQWAADGHR